jgi:hypothetical protein
MKKILRPLATCVLALGVFNLTAVTSLAAGQTATSAASAKLASVAPKMVSAKKPLTAQQLAKYQQQDAQTAAAAKDSKAGASGDTTTWIIIGAVVVVAVVALASGGGGGGGGGY